MKGFEEKIKKVLDEGGEVNTKVMRKALLNVLRLTQDLICDGETTSSAGSEQAPSDENLEPEEIEKVIPVVEEAADKKKKKKDGPVSVKEKQEIATSISPMRRKTVMDGI